MVGIEETGTEKCQEARPNEELPHFLFLLSSWWAIGQLLLFFLKERKHVFFCNFLIMEGCRRNMCVFPEVQYVYFVF